MFSKQKLGKNGYRSYCKVCAKIDAAKRNAKPEIKARNAENGRRNRKESYEQNSARIRAWNLENTGKRRAYVRNYQAKKLNATPVWADLERIKHKYEFARMMEKYTANKYHVDHIVPLQGESVCGLHVVNNLQILLAGDNQSKGNKHAC